MYEFCGKLMGETIFHFYLLDNQNGIKAENPSSSIGEFPSLDSSLIS